MLNLIELLALIPPESDANLSSICIELKFVVQMFIGNYFFMRHFCFGVQLSYKIGSEENLMPPIYLCLLQSISPVQSAWIGR